MSVEFTSDMNYVYKYQKSVPQNETANIVPSSTFRRTVSDIVITFYAIVNEDDNCEIEESQDKN